MNGAGTGWRAGARKAAGLVSGWIPGGGPLLRAATRAWLAYRSDVPVILISGSSGKTTTCLLLQSLLAERCETVGTRDNDNIDCHQHRFVFRLGARRRRQILVLEAGIQSASNAPRWNAAVASDVLILTMIGHTHLQWLHSREGVFEQKKALLGALKPGGTLLVNADDDLLGTLRSDPRAKTFGVEQEADFRARNVEADARGVRFDLVREGRVLARIESELLGRHAVYPLLAAASCASLFGLDAEAMRRGLARFRPAPSRVSVGTNREWTVLDDTYSSNPEAAWAALEAMHLLDGRKVVVLGSMLELGERGPDLHRELGRRLARAFPGIQRLFGYAPLSEFILQGAVEAGFPAERTAQTDSKFELLARLEDELRPGDVALFKGSNQLALGDVIRRLGRPWFAPPIEAMPAPRAVGAFGAYRIADRRHEGIDLPAEPGTPVRAMADGEIRRAGWNGAYGRAVRIRHFTNTVSLYAHLDRIVRRRGPVAMGEIIGYSGRTGIPRGLGDYDYPHLHVELRVNGVAQDPSVYWDRFRAGSPAV
ncbi:MAG TPA: Mur ligase family protein [Kiritimatiellia bacterium]|nr:Mur ligase family protein [Kiritimatiellia bacterium]HRZ11048.1 Mur ligase family protein [Kiritimatiellia bacterium]HSA18621.1 Mur ligase family protein [Kiritimatiellia bacterium]